MQVQQPQMQPQQIIQQQQHQQQPRLSDFQPQPQMQQPRQTQSQVNTNSNTNPLSNTTNNTSSNRTQLSRPPYVDPNTNIIYDTDQPEYEGFLTKQSMWLKVRLLLQYNVHVYVIVSFESCLFRQLSCLLFLSFAKRFLFGVLLLLPRVALSRVNPFSLSFSM